MTFKQSYHKELNVLDKVRIQPLKRIIKRDDLEFKYLITISYPYQLFNYNKVLSDNRVLRRKIRTFFKHDIRMWFFVEKHCGNGAHRNGYHRHMVMEDVPLTSKSAQNWMLQHHPELTFALKMGTPITAEDKIPLIKKVFRLCDTVPHGKDTLDIEEIKMNPDRVVAYCSKQFERFHPAHEVLDCSSSDVGESDIKFLLEHKQDGNSWTWRRSNSVLTR